jgi:hypothetical protein
MTKRMDQLKFMIELNWQFMLKKDLDKLFYNANFLIKFNQFLATDMGKTWLKSEYGIEYMEWQEG